jgi:hypothetical protein
MFTRIRPLALAVVAGLFALTSALTAQPPEPKGIGDLRTPQEQNAELFRKFQRELLSLAQKLERSGRPEDKERAKVIYAALELSRKENVESQFQKLVAAMAKGTTNAQAIQGIIGQDAQLTKALQDILNVLMTDDEAARIKAEIAKLEAFLKEARAIKRQQENLRAVTDMRKGDPKNIARDQDKVAKRTKDLGDQMQGGKKGKGDAGQGDPKGIAKADPKSEAKPGDKAGDDKADTREAKADDKKPGDPMKPNGDAKSGPKEGKPSDGQPKTGDGKAGQPKTGGEPKDGGQSKAGGQPKEGSPGKPSAGKPGDSKGKSDGKGDDKPPMGQQAGASKEKNDKGEQQANKGNAKSGGQQSGQPSDGQPGGSPPPQQQANQTPGRKQIQEAYPHQKIAIDELQKKQREKAGKQQDNAIEKLAKAIQELEKRLKQLREEEMLKLLANLEARCNRMYAMQVEVYEATKAIDGIITKNNGQKTNAEIQKTQQQADKENEIITEANKALKLLESEGSAVAFARVLEEVRQDMIAVQRRLSDIRVGQDTQLIEENIIAMLKDMVLALKKAQQDMKQKQQNPPPPSGQQKPGNQKLIDLLAELKLIKSLQLQVNSRTRMYAGKYQGEQTADPLIQAELQQLSQRQAKLEEMVNKIATGGNQ